MADGQMDQQGVEVSERGIRTRPSHRKALPLRLDPFVGDGQWEVASGGVIPGRPKVPPP